MVDRRAFSASVILNENTLWVVGGWDRDFHDLSSTEFVSIDSVDSVDSIHGPDLPFTVRCHR